MSEPGILKSVDSNAESSGALEALSARHQAMMERLVLDGAPQRVVAREFGISESRLSILRSSKLWKRAERELRRKALEAHQLKLESLRGKAIEALESTVTDADPRVRLQSAREILSRTGLGESSRLEVDAGYEIKLYVPKYWNNPEELANDSELDGLPEEPG